MISRGKRHTYHSGLSASLLIISCSTSGTNNSSPYEHIPRQMSFRLEKDLMHHNQTNRHTRSQPTLLRFYTCRCLYKSARKDNFLRHMRTCKRAVAEARYICRCGHETETFDEISYHLETCGKAQRGRPPKPPSLPS